MIVIIDYGIGNLASIKNMLKKTGHDSVISSDPEIINNANKLILPGVGSFDYGMEQLHSRSLVPLLNKKVLDDKTPILGICLGLQLMTKSSEEGKEPGLGWINASCKKFKFEENPQELKIPHMGWSDVTIKKDSNLFRGSLTTNPRFYFVHSFHLLAENSEDILVTAKYGYEFVCGIEKQNIAGVQFHPEKSHKFGISVLKNFAEK